jgi:hypothetical protein
MPVIRDEQVLVRPDCIQKTSLGKISCIGGQSPAMQLSLSSCSLVITPIDILYECFLNSYRSSGNRCGLLTQIAFPINNQ